MFGLGMPEILLILAIALIVIGPKKLPDLAKTLGRAMGEFKRSAQDFKRSIDVDTTVKDFSEIKSSSANLDKIIKETTVDETQADEIKTSEPEDRDSATSAEKKENQSNKNG